MCGKVADAFEPRPRWRPASRRVDADLTDAEYLATDIIPMRGDSRGPGLDGWRRPTPTLRACGNSRNPGLFEPRAFKPRAAGGRAEILLARGDIRRGVQEIARILLHQRDVL